MKSSLILVFTFVSLLPSQAQKKQAQKPLVKKALDHRVYDGWKEIPYKALTPDGSAAAFLVNPQEGDGKVVFYHLKTWGQDSVSRAAEVALSYDSRFAIFKIKPQQKLMKDLRRQKKKKEDLPKDSLGIYSFATRTTEKIAEVKSFKIPEKAGQWLAYLREAKKEEKPKTEDKDKAKADAPAKNKKVKKNTDDNGYTLTLRHLTNSKETQFGFVKEYVFAKYGQGLLFHTTGNDSTMKAGTYWYDLNEEKLQALYEGKSKYKVKGLAISEDGTQTAFLVDTDTTKALVHHFKLYCWKKGEPAAKLYDLETSLGIPPNWMVSEFGSPWFSKNGTKLFFGTSPVPSVQDTTLLPEEIVNVEVWRGEDDYIYPQQNKQLEAEKKRSYLSFIDLASEKKSVWNIGTREIPTITWGDEGNASVGLGETNIPYRKMITWDVSAYNDFYLFDVTNGAQKIIAKQIKGSARLSPRANYVYWFSAPDTAWFSYSIATEKTVKLTDGLKEKFAEEEDDHPDYPNSYGVAGWTKNDQQLLLYDRYDVWAFDPKKETAPVNLTRIGRKEKIIFRYLKLDAEERFIDPAKEILLSAFKEDDKSSGYYKLSLSNGSLTKLTLDAHRYGGEVKAKNADQILFTRESFQDFPDVWNADLNWSSIKRLSDVNPQKKYFNWGTVELVNWNSLDNLSLQGLLYKPEGFDSKKKYPMIVYFYEKESDNLHQHYAPFPHRSSINRTLYASNGYLIFVPDIIYKKGFPGESAHNCVMPGITALIAKGFVDEKNIGMQGHSWGGYQSAYLVTRTNLFKAAEAGAPVANMISAYGGIRWESGLSRMFQYERDQSRIGGSLWEKPMHYIENSPIFFADKIQTPLLLLHNDNDGAVPWYQGIEMYMALRRLNKPVWMLNYNGEPHWPVKRENRIDFQTRMMQYFDHYLKGAPAPEWMTKGVPAIEKGIKKGY